MTTVLSAKGQIVLPLVIRKQLQLKPGQDFQVEVEHSNTITLRPIAKPRRCGLVALLRSCPFPLEIPPRDTDDTESLRL